MCKMKCQIFGLNDDFCSKKCYFCEFKFRGVLKRTLGIKIRIYWTVNRGGSSKVAGHCITVDKETEIKYFVTCHKIHLNQITKFTFNPERPLWHQRRFPWPWKKPEHFWAFEFLNFTWVGFKVTDGKIKLTLVRKLFIWRIRWTHVEPNQLRCWIPCTKWYGYALVNFRLYSEKVWNFRISEKNF